MKPFHSPSVLRDGHGSDTLGYKLINPFLILPPNATFVLL
jgi:hypothetical protein